MTTIQTKTIHFKIIDNPNINYIQDQQGTLFVQATISFEKSATYDSIYYGYYDMQWLSLSSKAKPYTISDAVRSKILAMLADSFYSESDAFALCENYTYNFSDIETSNIEEMNK